MTVRIAAIGCADTDFDALSSEALRRADERSVDLTIVAIATRSIIGRFAPLSGMMSGEQIQQMQREPIEAATRAAREALLRLSRAVPARYIALARPADLWRDPVAALCGLDDVIVADNVLSPWRARFVIRRLTH